MRRLGLEGAWTLRVAGGAPVPDAVRGRAIAGTVPGCVHTDLMAAGLAPDPYLGDAEKRVAWIPELDWRYERRFEVSGALLEEERVELACDGLDTFATVRLNGEVVGEVANMHHPHRLDARDVLVPGDNHVAVEFASPVGAVCREALRLGPLPWLNTPDPFNFARKAACHFGWDWAPVLPSAGIWRPIGIEAWSCGRIASVRPLVVRATPAEARVAVHVDADPDAGAGHVRATLRRDGRDVAVVEGESPVLVVESPELWWPRGHGAQPLYDLEVELCSGGDVLDRWRGRVGLREVSLDTSADAEGSRLTLAVNGKPLFCRGANWIPPDCFPHRAADPELCRRRIDQAVESGCNTLRVWGGGIYETEAFYDACDERGVLVWQDFPFACAAYPEEEPHRSRVEAEARHNVARLSRHPSLVLWNGCNENLWGYCDWGWRAQVSGRTWGAGYYFELLPRVCAELDPTRPYWPGSPYSGAWDDGEPHPNLTSRGNRHVWEEWEGAEHPVWGREVPRFCSEFGFPAPACHATLLRADGDGDPPLDSPAMRHRQRSHRADRNLRRMLAALFGDVSDPADVHHLLQLGQARAITRAVEWMRSRWPRCAGALYWQLEDCWPAVSWAAVDGDGRPKLLWHASRRFFADRLLTFQPSDGGGRALFAINDTDEPWTGTVAVRRVGMDGRTRDGRRHDLAAAPRSAVVACGVDELSAGADPAKELLVAEVGGERAFCFLDADRRLAYPEPELEASLEGGRLTVRAGSLLRELTVHADRLDPDATVDGQLVTLLPGDEVTFDITAPRPLDPDALTRPPVLQHTNRFGGGPRGRG